MIVMQVRWRYESDVYLNILSVPSANDKDIMLWKIIA